MIAPATFSKETLLEIADNLGDERLAALLDFAEYLLRKQAEEDAADIGDSLIALKENGSIAWDEVKREINSLVQN